MTNSLMVLKGIVENIPTNKHFPVLTPYTTIPLSADFDLFPTDARDSDEFDVSKTTSYWKKFFIDDMLFRVFGDTDVLIDICLFGNTGHFVTWKTISVLTDKWYWISLRSSSSTPYRDRVVDVAGNLFQEKFNGERDIMFKEKELWHVHYFETVD